MATTEKVTLEIADSSEPAVELGNFASPLSVESAVTKIVVATFNIRYAVGSFLISGSLFRRVGISRPRRRPLLIEQNILKASRALSGEKLMPRADIIALQESDKRTARAGAHHVACELSHALKMNYAHAPMDLPQSEEPKSKQWYLDFEEHIHANDAGTTGIATLSRWPLISASRVDLPWFDCAWRPRLALASTIQIGTAQVHIFNSHIDPHASIDEQLAQHEAVLAHAETLASGEPTILLGDFNTLTPISRTRMRTLLEAHGFKTPMPDGVSTWRAGLIRLHTDWIFVRGAVILRWGVARPLSVSDHWPVWAEIELAQGERDESS